MPVTQSLATPDLVESNLNITSEILRQLSRYRNLGHGIIKLHASLLRRVIASMAFFRYDLQLLNYF